MNIGLFTDTYEPDINGVVSSVVVLKNALETLGHNVFVITNHNRFSIERVGNVLFIPGIELKKLYGYNMSFMYSFNGAKEIDKMNLDIIHVHTEFGVGLFGRAYAKQHKIPIVSTYHTAYEDYTHYVNVLNSPKIEVIFKSLVEKISKLYSNTVDAVIAPSLKTKEMLIRYGVTSKIYEIPTGLNLSRFTNVDKSQRLDIRQQYNIGANEQLAIFVGRIAQEKNITMILEAFKQIDNIRLMIVGDGPQLPQLKQYVKQLNIESKVIFTGKKENTFIPYYYSAADVFISASTSETQGMTYIEALASGLVVFARRDEVIETLVQEQMNGYLFDDANELATKLTHYFALNDEQKQQLKANTYSSIKQFDDLEFGRKVVKMYEEVIQGDIIIESVKFEKDKIRLTLNTETCLVDLDTYLELHLEKGKKLTAEQLDIIKIKTNEQQAYEKALKTINRKPQTEYEIRQLLESFDLDQQVIQQFITKLKTHRLINDEDYLDLFLAQSSLNHISNYKIILKLKEKGINITKEQLNRDETQPALTYAKKIARISSQKSYNKQINYIKTKLYENGFDIASIRYAIDHLNIEVNEEKEKQLLDKMYAKALKKYAKYSGYELERRVRFYLRTHGFNYDDINKGEDND